MVNSACILLMRIVLSTLRASGYKVTPLLHSCKLPFLVNFAYQTLGPSLCTFFFFHTWSKLCVRFFLLVWSMSAVAFLLLFELLQGPSHFLAFSVQLLFSVVGVSSEIIIHLLPLPFHYVVHMLVWLTLSCIWYRIVLLWFCCWWMSIPWVGLLLANWSLWQLHPHI